MLVLWRDIERAFHQHKMNINTSYHVFLSHKHKYAYTLLYAHFRRSDEPRHLYMSYLQYLFRNSIKLNDQLIGSKYNYELPIEVHWTCSLERFESVHMLKLMKRNRCALDSGAVLDPMLILLDICIICTDESIFLLNKISLKLKR